MCVCNVVKFYHATDILVEFNGLLAAHQWRVIMCSLIEEHKRQWCRRRICRRNRWPNYVMMAGVNPEKGTAPRRIHPLVKVACIKDKQIFIIKNAIIFS